LDLNTTSLDVFQKIAVRHVTLAEQELQRLKQDTSGWTMQQFLEHVQSSTQFPGLPLGVLEEMAQSRIAESRAAWSNAREKMSRRRFVMPPGENLVDASI
jgi:hypothetical protein